MIYVLGSGAVNPKTIGVHKRALEEKLNRPLRRGFLACHHCDVKMCMQPEHLYEGTRRYNALDARERLGHFGRSSSLTTEQQNEIRYRYATEKIKQSELAREFRVSQMTISNTVRRVYS